MLRYLQNVPLVTDIDDNRKSLEHIFMVAICHYEFYCTILNRFKSLMHPTEIDAANKRLIVCG